MEKNAFAIGKSKALSEVQAANRALFYGIFFNREEAMKALGMGVDVNARNKDGQTPLMCVAKCQPLPWRTALAKALIENGADVDARDNAGGTALIHAARTGNNEMMDLLYEHGARISVVDWEQVAESGLAEIMLLRREP